jgi:hypothetical protein
MIASITHHLILSVPTSFPTCSRTRHTFLSSSCFPGQDRRSCGPFLPIAPAHRLPICANFPGAEDVPWRKRQSLRTHHRNDVALDRAIEHASSSFDISRAVSSHDLSHIQLVRLRDDPCWCVRDSLSCGVSGITANGRWKKLHTK